MAKPMLHHSLWPGSLSVLVTMHYLLSVPPTRQRHLYSWCNFWPKCPAFNNVKNIHVQNCCSPSKVLQHLQGISKEWDSEEDNRSAASRFLSSTNKTELLSPGWRSTVRWGLDAPSFWERENCLPVPKSIEVGVLLLPSHGPEQELATASPTLSPGADGEAVQAGELEGSCSRRWSCP